MAEVHNIEESKDFAKSWVSSSRFLFYIIITALVSGLVGNSISLFNHRYKGKPDVEIQTSTKYKPEYK